MYTETITEAIPVEQKKFSVKTKAHQEVITFSTKKDITMHRGECSVSGCYCRQYVGVNVGTCENCGHHYDSHRY